MKWIGHVAVATAVLTVTLLVLLTPSIQAVPSFTRRYGVECSTCHTMWGSLNGAGITFRLSGYRAINGRDLTPVEKDIELSGGLLTIPKTFPLSIITGAGFDYRKEKREASDGSNTNRTGSSLALEDASLFLTSPIGKHLGVFMEFPMYETRAFEFTPTGQAEANDKTGGPIRFSTESPVFEVAKFWWNNLLPESIVPRDSLNLFAGVSQLFLAYAPGKVRLSVNQYSIYERRALDLISPKKVDDFLSGDVADSLFRLSEPQIVVEINGLLAPFGKVTDVGKRETFWLEYHLGVSNGSNSKADNNTEKDVYGRLVMRWYNQSLGVFAYYSPDSYGDEIRNAGAISAGGIMSGRQSTNSMIRVGPDMTLSLAPFGIPVWLENQFMYNRESDPTGFGRSFEWVGGFHQLNWQIAKKAITYGRFDWISGRSYDDRGAGGITAAKPWEWDIVAGLQYLLLQNVKLIGEYRHSFFEDKETTPDRSHLTSDGFTIRAMFGF